MKKYIILLSLLLPFLAYSQETQLHTSQILQSGGSTGNALIFDGAKYAPSMFDYNNLLNKPNNITGVGLSNRIAFWKSNDSLSYDNNLFFDGTNIGFGTTSPPSKLSIVSPDNSGGLVNVFSILDDDGSNNLFRVGAYNQATSQGSNIRMIAPASGQASSFFMYDGPDVANGAFFAFGLNSNNSRDNGTSIIGRKAFLTIRNTGSGITPPFGIYVGGIERLRIQTDGKIGVGLVPSSKFHIRGEGSTVSTTAFLVENSLFNTLFRVYDSGNVAIPNGTFELSNRTGTATTLSGFTSSDILTDITIGTGLTLSGGELNTKRDSVFLLREVVEGIEAIPAPGVIAKGWYRVPKHLNGYTLDDVTYTVAQPGTSGSMGVRLDINFATSTDGAGTFNSNDSNVNAACNTVVSEGDIIQLEVTSYSFTSVDALGLNYELIFTLE